MNIGNYELSYSWWFSLLIVKCSKIYSKWCFNFCSQRNWKPKGLILGQGRITGKKYTHCYKWGDKGAIYELSTCYRISLNYCPWFLWLSTTSSLWVSSCVSDPLTISSLLDKTHTCGLSFQTKIYQLHCLQDLWRHPDQAWTGAY